MKWLKLALRLIVGVFFIFSAYGKLDAMGAFEVYVFRSSFLSFDGASVVARLIVAAEIIAGVGIIFKLGYKAIWRLTFLFILVLTGFLAKQLLLGSDENCFCLGELMEMSPAESLLKNVVLIGLLLLIRKDDVTFDFRLKQLVVSLVFAASVIVPFVISPPDLFVKGQFNSAEYNQTALDDAIANGEISTKFLKGRKMLSFYSMKCKYCKMSSERISALVRKNDIQRSQVNIIFGGMSGNPIEFFEETHSQVFEFSRLPREPFLSITKGMMPLTLLIEDGKVISEMNYRTIDEKEITNFLNGKS
ncbi:DoxX protein [Owenweeksia hongkongensis DSM 17368]|uniref:DoxX protein n=1 Tax=Owenweeksia hongkongensis (strain DSM 17368 / CIP 108786 / JCM 12287 / NRRL B-23963 / UST20020801) TaxID=926562 RepID=G8R2N5_OWEHD|nr:DoxX family protein [Owenweeksia hongkongensis]AEV31840.1 DoxX protein [Owenweeksia hongkongensis DSM 17368]